MPTTFNYTCTCNWVFFFERGGTNFKLFSSNINIFCHFIFEISELVSEVVLVIKIFVWYMRWYMYHWIKQKIAPCPKQLKNYGIYNYYDISTCYFVFLQATSPYSPESGLNLNNSNSLSNPPLSSVTVQVSPVQAQPANQVIVISNMYWFMAMK